MTTTPVSAAATGLPESTLQIANDLMARAGDLRWLAHTAYLTVTDMPAKPGKPYYDAICQSASLCRAVEDYARQLEVRASDLFNSIDRVTA